MHDGASLSELLSYKKWLLRVQKGTDSSMWMAHMGGNEIDISDRLSSVYAKFAKEFGRELLFFFGMRDCASGNEFEG